MVESISSALHHFVVLLLHFQDIHYIFADKPMRLFLYNQRDGIYD